MSRNYSSIVEPKTLTADVSSVATQITLNNVTGLPSPPYVLVLNPDTASEEVVLVDAVQSNYPTTIQVTRAIESGATAKTHTNTNIVRHMIVGSDLQLPHDHIDLTTAHGATGAVVGTTNTQTLTGKTLTSPKINENVVLTATSTELNALDGITASTAELNIMDGVTSTAAELNILDGVTSTTAELNILDGVTSSTAEINILDGITASTAELNHTDGVTSAIQTQLNTLTSSIASLITVPTGVISPYAGPDNNIPAGYFLCDGQAVSRSTFATLFGVVDVTYGAGDGTTTFNVPNLKGRVPVGLDATQVEFDLLGEPGGAKEVTLTAAQIPGHTHGVTIMGSDLSYGTAALQGSNGGNQQSVNAANGGGSNPAGGGSHNNLQPYIVVNYIIKH